MSHPIFDPLTDYFIRYTADGHMLAFYMHGCHPAVGPDTSYAGMIFGSDPLARGLTLTVPQASRVMEYAFCYDLREIWALVEVARDGGAEDELELIARADALLEQTNATLANATLA